MKGSNGIFKDPDTPNFSPKSSPPKRQRGWGDAGAAGAAGAVEDACTRMSPHEPSGSRPSHPRRNTSLYTPMKTQPLMGLNPLPRKTQRLRPEPSKLEKKLSQNHVTLNPQSLLRVVAYKPPRYHSNLALLDLLDILPHHGKPAITGNGILLTNPN